MTHDYRIETLANTFSQHAQMAFKNQENLNKMFLEDNPGYELPDNMKTPFNIAQALSVMADEIQKLKILCK